MNNKRRKKLTRETVLEILGLSDEEFKEKGASIEEMERYSLNIGLLQEFLIVWNS